MYHHRIEAAPQVAVAIAPGGAAGATILGLVLLAVALPVLMLRLFAYGLGRTCAKLGTLAGIVGEVAIDAARSR